MEEALITYALGRSGLTALVGDRIHWSVRPQGSALPAIVLHLVDTVPQYADDGEVGLSETRVQADCWATTFTGAKALSRALVEPLSAAAFVHRGIEFQSILVESIGDDTDLSEEGTVVFRSRVDFMIWHRKDNANG